jgi:hypothetical protein
LSFESPALLTALLVLPVLAWILRAVPPRPVRQVFGGMFFLERLTSAKQKPVRTPPLILLLRLLAAALLIIGFAGPRLGGQPVLSEGPLTVVFDDGWDAAQRWDERRKTAEAAIRGAGGPVRFLTTTEPELSAPLSKEAALDLLAATEPKPDLADWKEVADALEGGEGRKLMLPGGLAPSAPLALSGEVAAYLPGGTTYALAAPRISSDALSVPVLRAGDLREETRRLTAISADGRAVASEEIAFSGGEASLEAVFRLPLALRNQVRRIQLEGVRSAGTTALIGASSRRSLVGIVSSGSDTLREGGYYIERALSATSELMEGTVAELIPLGPGLLVLDDLGSFRDDDRRLLETFVEKGGILVRFAGPSLLAAEPVANDPLLPAPLIGGERALGGALTWAEPQLVERIEEGSPLTGLTLDQGITVRRQVLVRPGAEAEIWVSLSDATPLVTAAERGEGLVVLIHVSALPTWSDLPVSGFFATMMQRLAALSQTDLRANGTGDDAPLPAISLLSGTGLLVPPEAGAEPLVPGEAPPPPGFYGEGTSEAAVQTYRGDGVLLAFTAANLPRGSRVLTMEDARRTELGAWLLGLALLLLAADALLTAGPLPGFGGRAAAAGLALALLAGTPGEAFAQIRPPLPTKAKDAALDLRFGYVLTGDRATDRLSEAGLRGLTRQAAERSSLEAAPPQGVDPDRDELSVYSLLYWPVLSGQSAPSDAALQRLEAFMEGGGLLIIDTGAGGSDLRSGELKDILGRLDAPPLEPLPEDHVLLFSFYRLDDLWGRNPSGRVWVESRGALDQRRDGVPSLIIAGRDWASAWALDESGTPLRPAGPGGEGRREMAFRSGINMAMVAVTGNYKADQADVEALLDDLGEEMP